VADKIKETKSSSCNHEHARWVWAKSTRHLGAVTKLRICKETLNVSETYVIIYWRKNRVNSTLYEGNHWEPFCFKGHSVRMRVW